MGTQDSTQQCWSGENSEHASHSVVDGGSFLNFSVTWGDRSVTLLKAQVALIVTITSSALYGLLSRIFLPTIPNRFSTGFRSSEFAVLGLKPSIGSTGEWNLTLDLAFVDPLLFSSLWDLAFQVKQQRPFLSVAQLRCLGCCIWFRLEKRADSCSPGPGNIWAGRLLQLWLRLQRLWLPQFFLNGLCFHNPLKVVVICVDRASFLFFFCTRFLLPSNLKLMCLATGLWEHPASLAMTFCIVPSLLTVLFIVYTTVRSATPQLRRQLNRTETN